MKIQKLFFYLILVLMSSTFNGKAAGRETFIKVQSVTVYADGELSSPGAYKATQDLIKAWGKQHANLANLIVKAGSAEARFQVLRDNYEAIRDLEGVTLPSRMGPRPPSGGVPARAEFSRQETPQIKAAKRIEAAWRKYKKNKPYKAMFAAVDENDPDLQENYRRRERLIQEGMPLVRDLQDYDVRRLEIDGEEGMSPEPRRRSPSPLRVRRSGGLTSSDPTEADWALLDAFVKEHKDTPLRSIPTKLKERDPGTQAQLCRAIQHPDFYERAKIGGMGQIKSAAMVTFCAGVEFDRSQVKGVKQRGRSPSPVREKIRLTPVVFPQGGGLESQQQAFTEAMQTMEANAAILGRQEEFQRRLSRAREELIAAGESYDNLTAAVLVMKADLPDALKDMAPHFSGRPVLAEFIANYAGSPPDEYVHRLRGLISSSPRLLGPGSNKAVTSAYELFVAATKNLQNARQDLERINREMLQLVNQ